MLPPKRGDRSGTTGDPLPEGAGRRYVRDMTFSIVARSDDGESYGWTGTRLVEEMREATPDWKADA